MWCGTGARVPIMVDSSMTSLDLVAAWTGDSLVLTRGDAQLSCSKGEAVSVEVMAGNFFLAGPASATAAVKAMGLPGAVSNVVARELEVVGVLSLNVSFSIPSDTGFGAADASASIESVVVQASTCSSFARTGGYDSCTLDPRPSTFNPGPSTLHPEPSTPNPQTSTFNPSSSTLKHQPPTLNPQPSTLNPGPSISTFNPQPSTLNPQPSFRNPKPYTLHPAPQTLEPEC